MNVSRHNMTVGVKNSVQKMFVEGSNSCCYVQLFPIQRYWLGPRSPRWKKPIFCVHTDTGKIDSNIAILGYGTCIFTFSGTWLHGSWTAKDNAVLFFQADCWTSEVQLASFFVDNCIFPRCITKLQHTGWRVGIEYGPQIETTFVPNMQPSRGQTVNVAKSYFPQSVQLFASFSDQLFRHPFDLHKAGYVMKRTKSISK